MIGHATLRDPQKFGAGRRGQVECPTIITSAPSILDPTCTTSPDASTCICVHTRYDPANWRTQFSSRMR